MTVNLKVIDPDNDQRWDEFVDTDPRGSIYHHSAWRRVLLSTYGYASFYMALETSTTGRFEGIFPLMLINSIITGKRLVSLPFTSYCPPLIPESKLEEVVRFALEQHPGVEFLELKCLDKIENAPDFLEKESAYMTHILDIGAGQGELFKSFHTTSICQRIKRAERNQIKLKLGETEDDLNKFYNLHITTRKKHGLPPHPYAFFANMWHILRPKGFMLVPLLEHQGQIIAGAIVLRSKNTFIYEYSASDTNKLNISPNQLLIWEVIKIACSEGARFFDFGRSSLANQTLIEFKSRWGAQGQGLMYYYYPKANRIGTEGGIGRQILNIANRLLPCSVLRLEGRLIYPHLG